MLRFTSIFSTDFPTLDVRVASLMSTDWWGTVKVRRGGPQHKYTFAYLLFAAYPYPARSSTVSICSFMLVSAHTQPPSSSIVGHNSHNDMLVILNCLTAEDKMSSHCPKDRTPHKSAAIDPGLLFTDPTWKRGAAECAQIPNTSTTPLVLASAPVH